MKEVEEYLDEAKLGKYHFKAMFVSGMGFFTDAYDLFTIGIAISLIDPLWKLSGVETGLLGSVSLISALIGSFVFGRIADKKGRKKLYGIEAMIMAIGALLSAISPNLTWLIFARFLLGIGIGGDYPVSAVIMSEYSNKKDRGKLVSMVFSMQAMGLIIGPLIALGLLSLNFSTDFAWRFMLGLGAVPALMVIYLRRKIPESPRYTAQVVGDMETATKAATDFMGEAKVQNVGKSHYENEKKSNTLFDFITNKKYMLTLLGTAGSWFLLDYAYYGNTISTPIMINSISSKMTLESKILSLLLIFLVFALPGYICSIFLIDKIGRKFIQIVGFAVMGTSFFILGIVPGVEHHFSLFLTFYGLSYFFTEFGPNTTTFVMPSELFPTEYRATGHGFSAGIGKLGAFAGVFLFPITTKSIGLSGTLILVSIIAFAGIVTTLLLPEPKGKSLENISKRTLDLSKVNALSK